MPLLQYLTDVYFESGMLRQAAKLVSDLGLRKPLIVTDQGVIDAGLLHGLKIEAPVYGKVLTNPTESQANDCLREYQYHRCDGLLAIGGGSSIDLAKCVGLLATQAGPLEQYAYVNQGLPKIRETAVPLVAIPTTAGSGSEVGRAALVTLQSGRKLALMSKHLLPKAVICDPELTLTLPASLTAATGFDALSHCIETYCSPRFNPVAGAIALDGFAKGYQHIAEAVHHPDRLEAREQMMMCALQGGLSFQKGLGAVHSLSHALGSLTEKRLHHGTLNAIFLPHVLRFNYDCCSREIDSLAQAAGLSRGSHFPDVIERLISNLGLPLRLSDLGVTMDDIFSVLPWAVSDHCTATNPRSLTDEDCLALYKQAL